jgi:hypothetical protein
MPECKCTTCDHIAKNPHQMTLHVREKHPERCRGRHKQPAIINDGSPLAVIREHQRAIHAEILNLDAERDRLMARIKEIDDFVAKAKTFSI